MLRPLGPVAVFASSNFPLAFSVPLFDVPRCDSVLPNAAGGVDIDSPLVVGAAPMAAHSLFNATNLALLLWQKFPAHA